MRRVATSILTREYEVVGSAANGYAAIDAAVQHKPDVVVLDIAMPELDGFQAAARIKAAGVASRIVFLSNYAGEDYILAGLSRGASAFVPKARMELDLNAAVGHAVAGRTFVPSTAILPRWHRPETSRHDLQVYVSEAFRADAVAAYFEAALEQGQSVIAIDSRERLQALDAALRRRHLDPTALAASGRYATGDPSLALEAVLKDGVPDPERYASLVGPLIEQSLAAATGSPPHVSVFGAIAPLLIDRGDVAGMQRLERIAHEYISTRPVSLLCGYPATLASDAEGRRHLLDRVAAEHATVVAGDA